MYTNKRNKIEKIFINEMMYDLNIIMPDCNYRTGCYEDIQQAKVHYRNLIEEIIKLFPKEYEKILNPITKEIDSIYFDINEGVDKDTVYSYAVDFLSSYFFTLEKIVNYHHKN